MEAKEARNRSIEQLNKKIDSQFDEIMKSIFQESSKGKFEIFCYYDEILSEVITKLGKLGYTISEPYISGPNEYCRKIMW